MRSPQQSNPILERRAVRRRALDTRAIVHMVNQEFRCRTRDLSPEGLALLGHEAQVPEGTFMRVQFRLPRSEMPIDLDGILVRTDPRSTGMVWGLKLLSPPSSSKAKIESYVEARSPRRRSAGPDSGFVPSESRGVLAAPPSRESQEGYKASSLDSELEELYNRATSENESTDARPRKKHHWPFT